MCYLYRTVPYRNRLYITVVIRSESGIYYIANSLEFFRLSHIINYKAYRYVGI